MWGAALCRNQRASGTSSPAPPMASLQLRSHGHVCEAFDPEASPQTPVPHHPRGTLTRLPPGEDRVEALPPWASWPTHLTSFTCCRAQLGPTSSPWPLSALPGRDGHGILMSVISSYECARAQLSYVSPYLRQRLPPLWGQTCPIAVSLEFRAQAWCQHVALWGFNLLGGQLSQPPEAEPPCDSAAQDVRVPPAAPQL